MAAYQTLIPQVEDSLPPSATHPVGSARTRVRRPYQASSRWQKPTLRPQWYGPPDKQDRGIELPYNSSLSVQHIRLARGLLKLHSILIRASLIRATQVACCVLQRTESLGSLSRYAHDALRLESLDNSSLESSSMQLQLTETPLVRLWHPS